MFDFRETILDYQKESYLKNRILGVLPDYLHRPTGVQLEITYKCSHRCVHCYNASGIHNTRKKDEELDDSKWMEIAEEISNNEVLHVIISGGEPFERPSLVVDLVRHFYESDITMGIITNGWQVSPDVIERLAKYRKRINWVQVSIDGTTPESNDKIRGVKGAFERSLGTILHLKRNNFIVKMATALMPENLNNLEDFFSLALFLDVDTLHFGTVFDIGAARGIKIKNQQKTILKEELSKLKDFYSDCFDVLISMDPCLSVQVSGMYRINSAYIIRPNGDLKLDCAVPVIFGKYQKPGDLKYHWENCGLKTAYDNPIVQETISQIKKDNSFCNIYDIFA